MLKVVFFVNPQRQHITSNTHNMCAIKVFLKDFVEGIITSYKISFTVTGIGLEDLFQKS